MIRYFKERDECIYKVFETKKYVLIIVHVLQIINKDNKSLEFVISNDRKLILSLEKVCTEISEKKFEELRYKMQKNFKKEFDGYQKFESELNAIEEEDIRVKRKSKVKK